MMGNPERESYVPGCKTDVFISYGSIDNQTGWVTGFQLRLEERLSVALGASASIWRDETRMDGLDPVWSSIEECLTGAAMIVAILSPRYVNSPACRSEIETFSRAQSGRRSQVSPVSRIVRVIKFPYDISAACADLRQDETVGYQFYEARPDRTTYREYSVGTPKFDDEVDRVAQAMANRLKLMRQERQAQAGRWRATPRCTIYLATVTRDRRVDRDTLVQELGRDHEVLSLPAGLKTGAEVSAAAARLVARANYTVHILSGTYGPVPEGTESSVIELEYRAALGTQREDGALQIVFIPEPIEATEPRQKVFLEAILRQDAEFWAERSELIRGGRTDLLEGLLDMISKDAERAWAPAKTKAVYVMCTRDDLKQEGLRAVRSHLFNLGYANDTPAFEPGELDLAEVEKQLVLGCSATLIYYGCGPDAWVKVKRRALIKILSEGRAMADHIRALYLDVPKNEFKQADYLDHGLRSLPEPGVPPLLILGDCEPFAPGKIQAFLASLERL